MKNDYQNLHRAALTLATKMLATLDQAQLDHMAAMTESGAKLLIQIELPDCKEVAIVLKEVEGKVWPVCKARPC